MDGPDEVPVDKKTRKAVDHLLALGYTLSVSATQRPDYKVTR